MIKLFFYFLKRFSMILIISLASVLLFSFLADTIESSKTITQENVGIEAIASLLLNKFIVIGIQTLPLSVYISLMILLFTLHIKNEYLSFLTAGIRPLYLLLFLLPPIIVISVINFFLLDNVFPKASREVDRLLVFEFKRFTATWTYFYRDRNWFVGKGELFYHYDDINESERLINGFEIIKYGENGIYEIITAVSVKNIKGREYYAEKVSRYTIKNDYNIEVDFKNADIIVLNDEFDVLRQRRGRPNQMSLLELFELIKVRERVGLISSIYRYELYNRILSSISLVLLCNLAILLFVSRLYLYNYLYFLCVAISILITYYLFYLFSSKLSESTIDKPLFAALLPLGVVILGNLLVIFGFSIKPKIGVFIGG